MGHLAVLCGCEEFRRPWWAAAILAVLGFLADMVGRSLAAALGFVALILLGCAAWLVTHIRIVPVVLLAVTLLGCAGCEGGGAGVQSDPCATCDGGGVENVNAKTIVLCVGVAACGGGGGAVSSGVDAGVDGLAPPRRGPAGGDAGVFVDDAWVMAADAWVGTPDAGVGAPDALPAAVDGGVAACNFKTTPEKYAAAAACGGAFCPGSKNLTCDLVNCSAVLPDGGVTAKGISELLAGFPCVGNGRLYVSDCANCGAWL